jgi:hypothetical protein
LKFQLKKLQPLTRKQLPFVCNAMQGSAYSIGCTAGCRFPDLLGEENPFLSLTLALGGRVKPGHGEIEGA